MIIEKFIKKIKGNDFELASNIPTSYLINKSIEMALNLVRGNIKFPFIKKSSRLFFVGRKTKIRASSRMRVAKGVNIGEYVLIDALSLNGVNIGSNVRIGDYSRILCSGTIRNLGKGFTIGDNCGIGDNCFFGAAGGIKIGDDVIMGQNVRFHSENHNYHNITIPIRLQGVTNKGIRIGNDCWIGAGAVFLDGVKVGNGCVIGANTLVNKDIPDNHVAVGNPVRIVKKRV